MELHFLLLLGIATLVVNHPPTITMDDPVQTGSDGGAVHQVKSGEPVRISCTARGKENRNYKSFIDFATLKVALSIIHFLKLSFG